MQVMRHDGQAGASDPWAQHLCGCELGWLQAVPVCNTGGGGVPRGGAHSLERQLPEEGSI